MKQPVQITFRDIPYSEFVEARIQEKTKKLDQYYDQIMTVKVVVEAPHSHQHKGNLFHVSIDLTVPDGELVVNRSPKDHHAHEDVYVAIRDAFEAIKRQLIEYAKKRRGKVKNHQPPLHGMVSEIISGEDYGRIETPDGREIYFHRNSLIDNNYDELEIGDEVRFSEEVGNDGPQASTVHMIGKHHIVDRLH
ncbi:MAG: HPF/RaiA family ribosome-associated protein [Gammaproteobacteria bacterium]|nr:HPF/RaiA family ribosome-associated protein [Gammaproteobacteria bacterium]